MIIVLHGRNSSAEKSTTVQTIKGHALLQNELIFSPTYNTEDSYEEIQKYLIKFVDEKVKEFSKETKIIFVGVSLGGFWAKHLANYYLMPAVLINPAIKYYGEVEEDDTKIPITIFVGKNDEVVDPNFTISKYKNRAKVFINSEGHRMHKHFDEIVKEILISNNSN